ncbi:MAG: TatD family hydrolase [Muribaculaceae bacterium]|nr:TatD family hydrolase [Muribaculaceae bacterium]
MMEILDIHTHRLDAQGALISVDPRQFDPQPGRWYSVGFHPWHDIDTLTTADWTLLEQCAAHPQVLAIGETGMDSLRGGDINIQATAFQRHLQLAHAIGKPVVAHCVRTAQRLLNVRRQAEITSVPLIIHGMRGNERVAQLLLDSGCFLSFGPRFNPAALAATPLDRLLIETDDSQTPINEVATLVAQALHLTPQQIKDTAKANAQMLLGQPTH